jgi:hypothetical protein
MKEKQSHKSPLKKANPSYPKNRVQKNLYKVIRPILIGAQKANLHADQVGANNSTYPKNRVI